MTAEKERKQALKFGLLFVACFALYFLLPVISDLIITYVSRGSFSEFINLAFVQVLPLLLIFVGALFFILFLVYFSFFTVDQDEAVIKKELILSGLLLLPSLAVFVFLKTSTGNLLTSDNRSVVNQAAVAFLLAAVIVIGVVGVGFVLKKRDAKEGKSS